MRLLCPLLVSVRLHSLHGMGLNVLTVVVKRLSMTLMGLMWKTHIYTKSMCTKCDYEWNDKFQLTGYCDTFMSCKGDDLLEFLRKAAINQHTQKEEVRSMLAIWLGIAENMIEETEKHGCAADVAFWQSLFDKTVEVLGGTLVDPNLLPEDES